jgi:hypothetical protein
MAVLAARFRHAPDRTTAKSAIVLTHPGVEARLEGGGGTRHNGLPGVHPEDSGFDAGTRAGTAKESFMRLLAHIAAAMLAGGIVVVGLWFMRGHEWHPAPEWKVIATEPDGVTIENKAMKSDTIIQGICDASPGIRFTIRNYGGNAFAIADEMNRPFRFDTFHRVLFLIVKHHDVSTQYINTAHYSGPAAGAEVLRANTGSKAAAATWEVVAPLGSDFMATLAEGGMLLIQNQYRQTVAEFSAAGANGAYETMRRICWKSDK